MPAKPVKPPLDLFDSQLELAWFAGIFEGEGCIDLWTRQGRNRVRLTVNMTDRDVIERIDRLFPTGHPIGVYVSPVERYKTKYIWRLDRAKRVRPILDAMLPWMGERRSAKIRDALAILDAQHPNGWYHSSKTHCKQGHEYTPENTYIRPDDGNRHCKTCRNEWAAEHRARKRTERGELKPQGWFQREKTHCIRGHEFTPENTYAQKGGRGCKACRSIQAAQRRAAKLA